MTFRSDLTTRHHLTSRKDIHMQHIELRLGAIHERQALERSLRNADRAALASARSIRERVGESIIRLGHRVAGESLRAPVWTG
ncbi:MAG: hypothetical protein A2V85_15160 [Chloroflexi bacterium RBG_16_72_14]|nr:MAG: hypothetical protein A2V85_15160 [Chloroflexi bacterium RBG_16_72_14]